MLIFEETIKDYYIFSKKCVTILMSSVLIPVVSDVDFTLQLLYRWRF